MNDGFESRRFALRTRDFLQALHDLRHRRSCRHNISTRQFLRESVPHARI